MDAKERIIVALDVPDLETAKPLVAALAPHVGYFKVGLELITAVGGPAAVALIKGAGGKVMYDGKFADIPNTMAGAARSVAALGVEMFTVHASAGPDSVYAAVRHAGNAKVIGVTVLTSLDDHACRGIFGVSAIAAVGSFAFLLRMADAHAIVCSPQEVSLLREIPLLRITPGVRPVWAAAGDQKRVMTPGDAIRAGADMLVIGRPILKPPAEIGGPVDAAKRIADEIAEATG